MHRKTIHPSSPIPPIIRLMEKVGRNEACPCGSGRKFKLCHISTLWDLPRKAIALIDISREIRAGDILTRQGNFYVKQGEEKGIKPHHLLGQEINIPNFTTVEQVEWLPQYFRTEILFNEP